jgi:hypothetical protein
MKGCVTKGYEAYLAAVDTSVFGLEHDESLSCDMDTLGKSLVCGVANLVQNVGEGFLLIGFNLVAILSD